MEGRRSPRLTVTSRAIETKAVELVLDLGFENVTVDMICEAAGISQRTFFNHFPTKNAAILGTATPRLDEQEVRRFLASDGDNLLAELLRLFVGLAPVDPSDPELASARIRIIGRTPALLQIEMERLFAVQSEMQEILVLRLRRTSDPGESEADTQNQARLITHLLAGILRYSIEGGPNGMMPVAPDVAHVQQLLRQVLPRLVPGLADPPGPG